MWLEGISNVAIPGSPGQRGGAYTVYVQMPDTLAINGNSKVMVADVFVGSIASHRAEELDSHPDARVEQGRQAAEERAPSKIGQTRLLGSQHVELVSRRTRRRRTLRRTATPFR